MKTLVIMAGLSGAGKSTIREREFSTMKYVDCDELKKTIEGYTLEKNHLFHAQSKAMEKALIYNYFSKGVSFVYDTTATNSDNVVKMTREAQALGYIVKMVYVKVKLSTALARNKARERNVPEDIIIEKHGLMKTSLSIAKKYVDEFVEIVNE
jgi:predicted kinase